MIYLLCAGLSLVAWPLLLLAVMLGCAWNRDASTRSAPWPS
ncbi:hypothetical protein AB0M87_04560 [Streptomyces sp. NPDC051320]